MATNKDLFNHKIFKQKRANLNISVRRLQALSRVNRSVISNTENGKAVPDGLNTVRLMIALDIKPTEVEVIK